MRIQIRFLFLAFLLSALIVASGAVDKIHFLKNDIYVGDSIVIESDGHFGLIDALNPGGHTAFNRSDMLPFVILSDNGTCRVRECDNGSFVKQYLDSLAKQNPQFKKLEFLLITHTHSDHIGGFSEIMDYIDANTIIFHKEPRREETYWENRDWKDYDYYKQMIELLNAKYGNQWNGCDVNKSSACKGVETDRLSTNDIDEKLRDYIHFDFGKLHINLYNLHRISENSENDNSIVMFITKDDGTRVALMGDVEARAGIEQQIANIIGAPVDILKSGHHGSCTTSSSQYSLDLLKPKSFIITSNREINNKEFYPKLDHQAAILHLMQSYGTTTYYTHQSEGAIVAELATNNLSHFEIKSYNIRTGLESQIDPIDKASLRDGWGRFILGKTDPYFTWKYINNGEFNKTTSGWCRINDQWYYLLDDGKVQTGLSSINDKWYFFDDTGAMKTGWQKDKGAWYYLEDGGIMVTDAWRQDANGKWYYLGSDGTIVTGWKQLNNVWYYLDDDGAMAANDWRRDKTSGKWYYFSSNGAMVTSSWIHPKDNKWYYVDDNGVMVSDTSRTIDGKEFQFDTHGVCQMPAGWLKLLGNWYYFDDDGTMVTDDWHQTQQGDWYYFNSDGVMVTNSLIHYKNRKWYYVDEEGKMVKSTTLTINNEIYRFGPGGECEKAAGWQRMNRTWYYFDDSEKTAAEAWRQDTEGKWYYLSSDGTRITGMHKINNATWYFFDDDGRMVANDWRQTSGAWYYFGLNGAMLTGWKQVNNTWYYLGKDGKMTANDWHQDVYGNWYYFGSNGGMKTSDWVHSKDKNWYFVDQDGVRLIGTLRTIDGQEYEFDSRGICSMVNSSDNSVNNGISTTSVVSNSASKQFVAGFWVATVVLYLILIM